MKNNIRMLAGLLAVVITAGLTAVPSFAAEAEPSSEKDASVFSALGRTEACIYPDGITASGDASVSSGYLSIDGDASLSVDVPANVTAGAQIAFDYRIPDEHSRTVSVTVELNGTQIASCDLLHLYSYDVEYGKIETDGLGNDVQPARITADGFWALPLRRSGYLAGEPFLAELAQGDNRLTFSFSGSRVDLRAIGFFTSETPPEYKAPSDSGKVSGAIELEAEFPETVSAAILYPVSDRTDPETSPSDAAATRLNTIGGSNWNKAGQWIRWRFKAEKDGYYTISARFRQNVTRGMRSLRRIMLDGRVPYTGMEAYSFGYDRDWQVTTLGDGEQDYLFYLSAGEHTLTMEAVMGDGVAVYEELENAIRRLNALYLQIIKITGTSPDTYRTYNLDKAIPGLTDKISSLADSLEKVYADYRSLTGGSGSELAFINEVVSLLRRYVKDSDVIITTLSTFNSDTSTLSTLLNTLASQPLQLDLFSVNGSGSESRLTEKAGLWKRLVYGVKQFVLSFTKDYQTFGVSDGSGTAIDVWISSGRDQANQMKAMIDESFTPQSGTQVDLSLVSLGLVEAIMAGRGPDVVVGAARTYPMDLGARGVLADYTEFEGFDSLRGRFQKNAFNAYTYQEHVYGVPETSDFLMMFVRDDVLAQLNLSVPETWDDFLHVSTLLAQDNLSVGVPITSIGTRLVQAGLTYYNEDFTATTLSTDAAYEVYSSFIKLYTDYEQPFAYNAGNRFKTGEMPIVIDYLSFYSTISVLAPEIRDSWSMKMIPGTVLPDGSVSRASDATGTADIILRSCKNPDKAFEFVSWWTGAETQAHYGRAIENILGESGRYLTANTEAISGLDWSTGQYDAIMAQQKTVCDIPEIPGSYIVTRNVSNIFYDIINNGAVVREALLRYSDVIDTELKSKKTEMEQLNAR